MATSLVFLAAGFGSRFGDGIKQIEPVGPNGEALMDYAAYDALCAGFDRIVFIIRRDIEKEFRDRVGKRMEKRCDVAYAYQDLDDLPAGFCVPRGREKPWGTGQALFACRNIIDAPFCVLNADDYYGASIFADLADFLKQPQPQDGKLHCCMAGFVLGNTLSASGSVTRGVCGVDENSMLRDIVETHNIELADGAPVVKGRKLDPATIVSMNIWGAPKEFIDYIGEGFPRFLQNLSPEGQIKNEYLLPDIVGNMLAEQRGTVKVLPTNDSWFGMTYASDRELTRECVKKLILNGAYPEKIE